MNKEENKGVIANTINWFKNLTVRGLLSAIFVLLVILILLSSVRALTGALSNSSTSLSGALYSVFVPADNATMTTDKKIVDVGEDFVISFKVGDVTDGLFKVSYPCDSEVSLNLTSSNKTLACDVSNYVTNKDNTISVRAYPANTTDINRLVITGEFENNTTLKSSKIGVVRITIRGNNTVTQTTSTNTVTNTVKAPTNNYQSNYTAKPDLAVRVLQTGVLDRNTNYFTAQTTFNNNDRVGIKFEVRNDGDANTGPWTFYATLPSQTAPLYKSTSQVSLAPGDRIEFTIGFDNLNSQYSNTASISVDSLNLVSESDETNNTASTIITNTGYLNGNSNYNGNYNYGNNGQQQYYGISNLDGVCYASTGNSQNNQSVNWYVTPTGGNYNNYTYYWTGSDGLSSYSQNPSMTYYTSGYKTASVTITSNGQSVTRSCSTNVNINNNYNYNNYGNNNLTASCYASNANSQTGQNIIWYPTVSGGNGTYSYSWSGSDGLSSYAQYPNITYSSGGNKTATLTVTSNGSAVSANCSTNINGNNNYYNYNSSNQDLSVRMLNVGTVNYNGQFTPASTVYRGQTAAIQVEVTNNGNYISGNWNYSATLNPSFPNYTYQGTSQAPLSPGEKVTLTIIFNNVQVTGNNYFNVLIDPNNSLNDTNRGNNTATGNLTVY